MDYNQKKFFTGQVFKLKLAIILAAEIAGELVKGAVYHTNDQVETVRFFAVKTNKLERDASQAWVLTAIDSAMQTVVQDVADLQLGLATEITDRQGAVTQEVADRNSAINSAITTLSQAVASDIESLKDTTVRNLIIKNYTADEAINLATLMAGQTDGIFNVSFKSNAVENVATVTDFPGGVDSEVANITYGDKYRVVMDGGNITSVTKDDDITKAKWAAQDAAIAALVSGTVTDGENGAQKVNGKIGLGSDLTRTTVIGGAFPITWTNDSHRVKNQEIGVFEVTYDATTGEPIVGAATGAFAKIVALEGVDGEQPGLFVIYPPNP